MIVGELVRDVAAGARRASPAQRRLRTVVLLGPIIAFGAGAAAAGHVLAPVAVLVVLLAGCCALWPDSNLGLLVTVVVSWHWAGVVHDQHTPWVLIAAAGLLVFHVAMALASTAPAGAGWPSATWSRWGRRASIVGTVTVAAWLLTLAADAVDVNGGAGLLVVAAFGLGAAALLLRARSAGSAPTG